MTVDYVEEKLDGMGKMNETLKKNSLDINILKFLPYRIDSLDNAIGNILNPHKKIICFFKSCYLFAEENIVKIDGLSYLLSLLLPRSKFLKGHLNSI